MCVVVMQPMQQLFFFVCMPLSVGERQPMVCCCYCRCGHKKQPVSKRQIIIQINFFQQKWFRINCSKMNEFSGHIVVTVLTLFIFGLASGNHCKGCTPLDSLTFDKMLNHFRVSLIKIDVPYPYGEKQVHFYFR